MAERARIRMDIVQVREQIKSRRRQLEVEMRRLDKVDASLAFPWKAAGSVALHGTLALLSQSRGRIWALRLQHSAWKMFGLTRGVLWTSLRALEREGVVRI